MSRQISIGVSDPQAIENVDAIKKNYSLDWDILVCLTNSDGMSFPPVWSHMATAKKADRRKILAKYCKATARQWQVIAPLISPLVLERADTLEWRIEIPDSWWSGLSPFLVLSLPSSESLNTKTGRGHGTTFMQVPMYLP